MKPLQSIAMGLVVIVLVADAGGFDVLADPLGWVLVLLGVRALPDDVALRAPLLAVAALAGVVSVPLWVPDVVGALDDADESLAWAADLPRFGALALLCLALAQAAEGVGDRRAGTWWRTALLGTLVVVALPVLVFGGGLDGLGDAAGVAVAVVPLAMIVLLFLHAGRPWAAGRADAQRPPTGNTGGGR